MKKLDILPVNDLNAYIALFMQSLNVFGYCEKFELFGYTCVCEKDYILVYNASMIIHRYKRSYLQNVINTKIFNSEEDKNE